MADKPSLQQTISDVRITDPVRPAQTNTGSTAGDVLAVASFGLDLLQRHQKRQDAKASAEAQQAMVGGVNRILQAKADRDAQGIGVQQNLLQTQQELNAFKAGLAPGQTQEVDKLIKSGLGFSPSAKITETQVSQFDQERDKLNSVGIDTRDMSRQDITTEYLKLNKREADLEAKNSDINSQIQSLNLQAKTRESDEAVARLEQTKAYNSIRAIGVNALDNQKRLLNQARQSGDPQAIKEAQAQFLQMASEAEAFFTSSMVEVSQANNFQLDESQLNTQTAGIRAWANSLIKSEDNSILSEANKRSIDLVTSDLSMRILSQSPEVSGYAALASLKIPVDPVSSQTASLKASAVAETFYKEMASTPGATNTSLQEDNLSITKGYIDGKDLMDSLRSMETAGKLPEGRFDQVLRAKMNDERDIAKQIMNNSIMNGGGQAGADTQKEAEGVLFSAVNSTMSRAVETGDLERLGPDQVGYVLDVLAHPNFDSKIPTDVREEITSNLGQFSNQVFDKQYFNDASRAITQDMGGGEEFDIAPVILDVDSRGNMRWMKNPEFTQKSSQVKTEEQLTGSTFLPPSRQDVQKQISDRIDKLVVKLNKNPLGNQLIDVNAKLQDVDKKELADRIVARSQANLSSLDRKMFKVSDSVISQFDQSEEQQQEEVVTETPQPQNKGLDEATIREVATLLKENPDANIEQILEFMGNRNGQ